VLKVDTLSLIVPGDLQATFNKYIKGIMYMNIMTMGKVFD
jgi:hypothetical protein